MHLQANPRISIYLENHSLGWHLSFFQRMIAFSNNAYNEAKLGDLFSSLIFIFDDMGNEADSII